jgi:hypothetical protein
MPEARFLRCSLIVACSYAIATALAATPETSSPRIWIDDAGKHETEGELLSLESNQISKQLVDGKEARVELNRLGDADQQYARTVTDTAELGSEKNASSPLDASSPPNATSEPNRKSPDPTDRNEGEGVINSFESHVRTVVSEGTGTSPEDALKNAFRAAVRQAVGIVVDAQTLTKNDELIDDQILTYSDGFIRKHTILRNLKRGDLFQVSIRAEVEQRSLTQKLKSVRIAIQPLDGAGLIAKAKTGGEEGSTSGEDREAEEMVRRRLVELPISILTAQVTGEPHITVSAHHNAPAEAS